MTDTLAVCLQGKSPFQDHMIRERIWLSGEILSLEPEDDIVRYPQPPDHAGALSEKFISKHLGEKVVWAEKHAKRLQAISKQRERNIERAEREMNTAVDRLKSDLATGKQTQQAHAVLEQLMSTWAWALDGENPPPASVAARFDIPGVGALKIPFLARSRL